MPDTALIRCPSCGTANRLPSKAALGLTASLRPLQSPPPVTTKPLV